MQRREYVLQESIVALKGGTCSTVSVSGTSAQSAAITSGKVVIYSTVDVYMRQGSNPTAVATGADQFIPANTLLRIVDIEANNKLAFISGTSGTVYISPST